jgi:hypothetical protein
MVIGEIRKITYQTQKSFDKFETVDYFHKLGEETKERPQLVYDYLSQLMQIVGARYYVEIPADGEVSRGIID